jgi:flagellar protein FlaI
MKVADRLRRMYDTFTTGTLSVRPYDLGTRDGLAEFTLPPHCDELERYWINSPFAFVVIYFDNERDEERYHVAEPALDDFHRTLLENLKEDIRNRFVYAQKGNDLDADQFSVLHGEMESMLNQYGVSISDREFYSVLYHLHRGFSGYQRLQPLLDDPHIEDISCDGYGIPVYVYHDEYADIKTNLAFEDAELDDLVIRLGQMSNRQLSVGEPISNATLPDGSRAELVYTEEVSPKGSAFTIRQYDEETMSPVDLVKSGTFSIEQMVYFWLAIENNMNLIFAGGTASGKTTSLNAISMFMSPASKVITIEDTREISLAHENWLSNVTRERLSEGTSIDMYALLRSALRHRPEYIIVGEVRGEEARTLFQAMNTGHTTYSTMHADSVQTVINRLENEPINVPRPMVQSLDILSVQRQTRRGDERVRRAERVVEIGEIDQMAGDLNYSDLYNWEATSDTFAGEFTDSSVLQEIRESLGWSERELREEVRDRKRVLEHLVDRDTSRYDRFTAIVKKYAIDPDDVLEWVDDSDATGDAEDDRELPTADRGD